VTTFEQGRQDFEAEKETYRRKLCNGQDPSYARHKLMSVRVFWSWLESQKLLPQDLQRHHFVEYALALESGSLCKDVKRFSVRTLAGLRASCLKWTRDLQKRGVILCDPFAEFSPCYPAKSPGRHPLTVEQVQELLDLPDLQNPCGLRDRAIFEVCYGSGLRISELFRLTLSSVELPSRCLHLRTTKNGWDRTVPLTRSACHFLNLYLRKSRPHFYSQAAGPGLWLGRKRKPLALSFFPRMATTYSRQLNFQFSFHKLRHSCATHLLEAGASVGVIASLLGHERLNSTQLYTHLQVEEIRKIHACCHPRG